MRDESPPPAKLKSLYRAQVLRRFLVCSEKSGGLFDVLSSDGGAKLNT